MWWRKVVVSETTTDKVVVGILAFEIAGLMSKVVNLWHSLSDKEVVRMREEIVNSIGVQKLVGSDDGYLMDLALNEMIENFGIISRSVARLGKKCVDPVYQKFEHFVNEPIEKSSDWFGWEYRVRKMERKVKKMERFVTNTMQLCQELEVLAEVEQTFRRIQANPVSDRVKLLEFRQKVMWQRQEVKNLRGMSPWNRTYDYIVRLLARSLFTILERMKHVFGISQMVYIEGNNDSRHISSGCLHRSHSFSALKLSPVYPSENNLCFISSGPLGRTCPKSGLTADKNRSNNKLLQADHQSSTLPGKHLRSKSKRLSHGGPFKGCMMSGSDSPVLQGCKPIGGGSKRYSGVHMKNIEKMVESNTRSLSCGNRIYYKLSLANFKRGLLTAPPSTLGDAALALHYANVIVLIEKLALSPHLIGFDARDDLYNMLTARIRTAVRARLQSYGRTLASSVYDASLASEWSVALVQILEWLAPLAHNMIRWHSERNFEKENVVSGTNVLLVQTLHFANKAKTEAAITELLVGLNYVCGISRELNQKAMPETAGSRAYVEHLLKRDDIAYNVL